MNHEPARATSTVPRPEPAEPPVSYVQRVTRSSGTSFYYAFLTLPRPRREAIFAVYAFCKAVDSAVDESPNPDLSRSALAHWRQELEAAFRGQAREPIAIRVGEVSAQFELSEELFQRVIEGVACDLEPRPFETWDELGGYCDLVAGAVGRLCVRIFGHREPWADDYADKLGRALQVTNILRDLGPDAHRGRFYLPQEDLRRFDVAEAEVLDAESSARLGLLTFEAERARGYFDAARRAGAPGAREMCAAEVMAAIYRRLLERIVAEGFPLREPVVRVRKHEKLWLAAKTWLRLRLAVRR